MARVSDPALVASDLLALSATPQCGLPELLGKTLHLSVDLLDSDVGAVAVARDAISGHPFSKVHSVRGTLVHRPEALLDGWLRENRRQAVSKPTSAPAGKGDDQVRHAFEETRSCLRVPLLGACDCLGWVQVEASRPRAFNRGNEESLRELGRWSGRLVERFLLRQHAAAAGFDIHLIGGTREFLELEEQIHRVAADAKSPVLITGERGSGKELVAYAIHYFGERRNGPFVPVNSAAFADSLFQDELFGHERGAFTGAQVQREGVFQSADGGSLFFDEIGDMPAHIQAALLRTLDHGKIRKIGCDETVDVDVRIIAATNQDLEVRMAAGEFRSDLYDRLAVFHLEVPPLRERREDIPLLARYFFKRACECNGRQERREEKRACQSCFRVGEMACAGSGFFDALDGYDYPGNVRELRNLIYRLATVTHGDELTRAHVRPQLDTIRARRRTTGAPAGSGEVALEAVIRHHIEQVLEMTGRNKSEAARRLDLPLTTLINKMKKLGID